MAEPTSPAAMLDSDSAANAAVQQCPVCHQPESRPLCSKDGYQIVACIECGCEYVTNPPDEKALKAYYAREEWFEGGEHGGYQNYDVQTQDSVEWIKVLLNDVASTLPERKGSLLDLGCGYGSHLKVAAELGWRCFGIEISDHARDVAKERLGDTAMLVSCANELIPHPFDVILMLDVVEHVSDPYKLFYELYALGAIQPHTRIILTTPNAASSEAVRDPGQWIYRHPPSHLTYYTKTSLEVLFQALRFTAIDIQGLHPLPSHKQEGELSLDGYAGLLVNASGSDFQAFMQERYVPSTWSEIAEYEHFPRYELACRLAADLQVLDFGCGTGYGSAMLASVARSALGVDIDASALDWARRSHRRANLTFLQNSDFLADFEPYQFDLITCFEMIEHVNETDQERTIQAFAKVLRSNGLLLISTPNPEVTGLYGANPYHLRERTREEFLDLLKGVFASVQLVDQYALTGVFFAMDEEPFPLARLHGGRLADANPLAYVAVCSQGSLPRLSNLGYLDTQHDYISGRLEQERRLVEARYQAYEARRTAHDQAQMLQALRHQIGELSRRASDLEGELNLERRTLWFRLGQRIRTNRLLRTLPVRRGLSLAKAMGRRSRRPFALPFNLAGPVPVPLVPTDQAYRVNQPAPLSNSRPKVLHAIANFCLGGSSRLVVDLLESLGDSYEQIVVTRHVPTPPAYHNLTIYEYAYPTSSAPFEALIDHFKPDFIHVHYWGECDHDWYVQVFSACEKKKIPVIQNVNTPIAPYKSSSVSTNVYVSDYLRQVYDQADTPAMVILPGSDLDHFSVAEFEDHPDDCIGMVYRLESDKLNSASIDVFIKVARLRPQTRCLIVGDGKLRPAFKQAVCQAGVQDNFEFTGYVSYQELPKYYARMSVFVAPVWKESFGQVSAFAMNMGLPVVGYAIGAIPSIIGDEKLMANIGDSDALAACIVSLLDDRELRLSIGRRNHAKAQSEYSVQSMVNRYRSLYDSMIASDAT